MRKWFKILIILLFAFTAVKAQNKGEVKRYVKQQIQSAIGLEKVNRSNDNRNFNGILLAKILFLISASALSFGYVFRRRNKIARIEKEKELKNKIKILRDEKLSYEMEPRLKMIRRKLSDTVPEGKVNIKVVPQSAKRLSIAQEEILLAARLNFYSKQSKIGGSIA